MRPVEAGNRLADAGQHLRALVFFDQALAEGDDYVQLNRGNSLESLGRHDEAITAYRKAAEAGEGSAWFNLASLLSDQGYAAAAVGAFIESARHDDPKALPSLALHYRVHGDRKYGWATLRLARRIATSRQWSEAIAVTWRWEDTEDMSLEAELETAAEIYPWAATCLSQLRSRGGRAE